MFEETITRLADGASHALAELSLSPADVATLLDEAASLGIPCEARGDLLRIPGGIELLERDRILAELPPRSATALNELELHWTIDSTNTHLMARVMAEGCHAVACFAERQEQGRGRRGRTWVSPFGRNVYLSVAWQMSTRGAPLDGLSLAVGVAAADALASCGIDGIELKWPNDLLHGAAKLGGILVEMSAPREGHAGVVVGVGLNLQMSPSAAGAIDQHWTDVSRISGDAPSRNRVAGRLLGNLLEVLDSFAETGFGAYRERWEALDGWRGRSVELQMGDRTEVGVEAGVDERGALRLETPGGVRLFAGGEISLRSA